MAESWASLLGRLQRAYKFARLDCGNKLRPPARLEIVRQLGRQLDLSIPPSLRAVWRIHGGQGYVMPGTTGLFGSHRLHSPTETAENYQMFLENNLDPSGTFPPEDGEIGYFHPRLLPFASWDAYNLCIDSATGMVWEFSPNYGTRGGTSRSNMRVLVGELLTLLAAGREPKLDFIYGPRKKVVS